MFHQTVTNIQGAVTGIYCHYCNDRDLCSHGMITSSLGLLQVYTVTIAMMGTYIHRMITSSPGHATGIYCHYCNDRDLCSQERITNSLGLLQVYTVTIAMIGTYVHVMITMFTG